MATRDYRDPGSRAFTSDDLGELYKTVCNASIKWKYIGLELEVKYSELQRIETEKGSGDTRGCLLEVLNVVLKDGPVTAKAVATALRSQTVSEYSIADKLESNETLPIPDSTRPTPPLFLKENVLHYIAPNISKKIFPYTKLKNPYSTHVPFGMFIVLQIVSMIFDRVFQPPYANEKEYINRVVFFVMRAFLMVVIPSICYAQLCRLGTLEKRFTHSSEFVGESEHKLNADCEENVQKVFQERKISLNPLMLVHELGKLCKFEITCYQVLIHGVVLPLFLFYLGVFRPSAHNLDGETWRQRLLVNFKELLEVWNCIATIIVLILSGTLKDVYCLENHLATVVSESDSNLPGNKGIFKAIRKRWQILDVYLHVHALLFSFLPLLLLYYGELFTPSYVKQNADEHNIWNMLTVLITIMQLGGSSASPDIKAFSILGYIAVPIVFICARIYINEVDLIVNETFYSFQFTPVNINLSIYTTQCVSLINWLLCLLCCYWRQKEQKTLGLIFCVLSLTLMCLSFSVFVIREFKNTLI